MTPAPRFSSDSALAAVEEAVREAVGVPAAECRTQRVSSRVYRVRCTMNGTTRSVVAKRLDPDIARRNELVARRWLPAAGLGESGPPLLSVAAERDGSSVWHVYDDLGDCALDAAGADWERVTVAVAAIARIHTRFAGHALLPECRLWGGDLGTPFYVASVGDAIAALDSALTRGGRVAGDRSSVCVRLHSRLLDLLDEQEARANALRRSGGPETLLHGDLWPMNVLVGPIGDKLWARLIDWDHAAVGPVSYDLSTFLSRFPVPDRTRILALYEEEVERAGWRLASPRELNLVFETAELARIANRVIWPALAAWEDDADWAFDALLEVERWFEQLTPILPLGEACSQS